MPVRPVILPPATPSELVETLLAKHRHPTTLLICWPRKQFLDALVQDVGERIPPPLGDDDEPRAHSHALLRATLMQVAVSRHMAVAFIPTVTHLRAYLAAFFACDSNVLSPPALPVPSASSPSGSSPTHSSPPRPLLLVYGFLELHRQGTEWSAQGLNTSAAGLVESAARNGLRAAIVEPRKTESQDELTVSLDEGLPLLNGSKMRDDGTWSGRLVSVRRVLGRWFTPEDSGDDASCTMP